MLWIRAIQEQVHLLEDVDEVPLKFQPWVCEVGVGLDSESKRVALSVQLSVLVQP